MGRMVIPSVIYLDEAAPPQKDYSFDTEPTRRTPGYYFRDDEHDLVGPYPTRGLAEEAVARYFSKGV